ncbi:MAG TPA: hypothetical protein VIZ28_02270 [Chitinophagaceae bacterium]
MNGPKQDKTDALIHWNYSRDEWKRFMRWKKRREGVFRYTLYLLWPGKSSKTPDIIITKKEVRINDVHEVFHDGDHELRRISIREAGKMNVLEITYENLSSRLHNTNDIYILVPKGKLREAIELQERIREGR